MASLPVLYDASDNETAQPGIDERELATVLQREYEAATSEYERLREHQDHAFAYYEAKPFGNEVAGRSQIVLPDVQEAIDHMSVAVLRVFVSGDRVVEFEATDEESEEGAREATSGVGFNFMRQQDGYRTLHDWCVSGLLDRYGVVKTMVTTEERVTRETITISDPVELEGVGEGATLEDVEENQDGTVTLHLKFERSEKRFMDMALPASEFRFSPRARHEDEADYLAHVSLKTRSDLVEMGFDRDQVYSLPTHDKLPDDRRDQEVWQKSESSQALEEVLLCEEYARIDLDDDGIAERVQVFRVANDVLRWSDGELAIDTVEEQPFSVFCPFPRPHRLVGWSLADKVMDVQLTRSTVARQLMDGMYNANMPRPIVSERGSNENTIGDILSPVPGAPIRVDDPTAITPYQTAFDVGKSMMVLEWSSREGQARSGAMRGAQTLDPNSLNNQTATEYAGDRDDAQSRQEFIARNLAEALSRLMAKKYRLMKAEAEPFRIKMDGQYKLVDPRKWPDDMNVTIRVGLGTGSKDKRIQARMMLAPMLAEGFEQGQVTPKHLFNAVDGLVRDLGIGQGDDYWIDPEAPDAPQQPDKPDPEMVKVQGDQQREDAKLELERQKAGAALETERAVMDAKIELMREEAAAKLDLEREKAGAEAAMNRERMDFEMDQAREQAEFQREMARESARAKAEEASIAKNRPGGDLDK